MQTAVWIVVLIVCVLVGAGMGYLAGYGLWKLGFEILGSAVALVVPVLAGLLGLFNAWRMKQRPDPKPSEAEGMAFG